MSCGTPLTDSTIIHQIKPVGECHVCKRVCALLQIHARQCKQSQCPVPHCMAISERFRQLKQQQ